MGKDATTNPPNSSLLFDVEDCEVFGRYPNSVRWTQVSQTDQAIFRSVRNKLKKLAENLANSDSAPIPLTWDISNLNPNGNSPRDIWCCVYPSFISNKSYALQITVIVSERGAEVCCCLGAGSSQLADPVKKHELEAGLKSARKHLLNVPPELITSVEKSQTRQWFYKKTWRDKPRQSHFASLKEWLIYAGESEVNGASISHFLSPTELQAIGTGIFDAFKDALVTFGPILKVVYPKTQVNLGVHAPLDQGIIAALTSALKGADLIVSHTTAVRFVSALVSKRFILATGLSGSGKTKLAQVFARWITPTRFTLGNSQLQETNGSCYAVVPVGADWTGNENILGYPDGLQATQYVAKPALDLILHAADHTDVPHFLILDEMNLSHVERYFADILSVIESDEGLELYSGDMETPETWRKTSAAKPVPPKLRLLPENLFIIGTVNVDETTYMFSPKVLDRANVIEFRMDAGDLEDFLSNPAKPDLSKLDGKGASFGTAFVNAAKNPVAVPGDVKAYYDAEMMLIFKTLQAHGAEFGYRTAYETARFIHFYKLLGNHPDGDSAWFPGAFDCVIFQKMLPKLHGSRTKLGPVLRKLWFLCVNGAADRGADALMAAEEAARSTDKKTEPSVVVPEGAPYPLSAEKIGRMWRLLLENGFASFAEA